MHAVHAVIHKDIVTGATHSDAGVLKDPPVVNWKDTIGLITQDKNTVGIPPEPLPHFGLVMDLLYPQLA